MIEIKNTVQILQELPVWSPIKVARRWLSDRLGMTGALTLSQRRAAASLLKKRG